MDAATPSSKYRTNVDLPSRKPLTTQHGWRLVVKVLFDRLVGLAALIVTSPVMAIVAMAVVIVQGSPVFFQQERPGRGGKPFRLVKFRTMRDERNPGGQLLPDEQRLTGFGRWLRASSLDELPQLWNVVRGDLSLVGPRPLLMQYLPRYTAEQARRHDVLPGITGWAQVNGRNAISWDQKFALDLWYVDHWSLTLDATILLKTVSSVFRRTGISTEGHATMPEFMGNERARDGDRV